MIKEQILAEFKEKFGPRIGSLEQFAQLHGWKEWAEETIPEWLTSALQRVENDCEVRAAIECVEHEKVAEQRGRDMAVTFLTNHIAELADALETEDANIWHPIMERARK